MAKKRLTISIDTHTHEKIAEFHPERDTRVLQSGSKEHGTMTGNSDRAWRESKYRIPEGMTLLEYFLGSRAKKKGSAKKR